MFPRGRVPPGNARRHSRDFKEKDPGRVLLIPRGRVPPGNARRHSRDFKEKDPGRVL